MRVSACGPLFFVLGGRTCFTVPDYPVVSGNYLWELAPKLNANPGMICMLNKLPNCSLIRPGQILHIPQTECTETDSYSCYTMPYTPAPGDDDSGEMGCLARSLSSECDPLEVSGTLVPRGDTGGNNCQSNCSPSVPARNCEWCTYDTFFVDSAPNNQFAAAYKGLNAAFKDVGKDRAFASSLWMPNMHAKIPKLSACTTADPNACFAVTNETVKQAAEWRACLTHDYRNCTWPDSNSLYLFGDLMFSLAPENGMVVNRNYNEDEREVCCVGYPSDSPSQNTCPSYNWDFLVPGMQLRLPFPKLVPWECPAPRPSTGGGGPSSTEECVDKPGPGGQWCYRIQQWICGYDIASGSYSFSGDYLYNISQNVPSLPMPGPDPWKPWCTFPNCSLVQPLAAVPIPIAGGAPTPSPSGSECHPSKTCNVCAACCQEYIPDGPACDSCVQTECPHNECDPSKTCNVCAKCCQPYIPDGSACDSCVTTECK